MSFISGALTLVCLIFAISMIPNAFKQYPTKNKPLIEVKPREIVINGTAVKISDIYQMRLTLTVDATGKKDEILQTLEALASKEPPRHTTGNLDFAVKDVKPDKPKTLYTTVADSYEALIAVRPYEFQRYRRRNEIIRPLKKRTSQTIILIFT